MKEDLTLKIVDHMGRAEEQMKVLHKDVLEVKKEQVKIKDHSDKVVRELQRHFDNKLLICNEDVMNKLEKSHLDKYQVRKEMTVAIKASEKRQRKQLMLVGVAVAAAAAFLYQYGEPILKFIMFIKED